MNNIKWTFEKRDKIVKYLCENGANVNDKDGKVCDIYIIDLYFTENIWNE